MTRGPKREIIRHTNERDFPHLVELALPPEGFRSVLLEIDAFHRNRRIPVRRGQNRHEVKQVYKAPRTIAGFGDSALAERTSAGCPGEPPIGDGFDAWLATTRSVARCRTDSTRERAQAGTAASRSS
jgi:hypothetical protein